MLKGEELLKFDEDTLKSFLDKNTETNLYEFKVDLNLSDEEKKSELIKDIVAIANSTVDKSGLIILGVDNSIPHNIVGMKRSIDDAQLQQLLKDKIYPDVKFIFYNIKLANSLIGVMHIFPSLKRPHIVSKDYGKLREGQLLIRKGSSTRGMTAEDLFECFYGQTSPHFSSILKQINNQQINNVYSSKVNLDWCRYLDQQIEDIVGF